MHQSQRPDDIGDSSHPWLGIDLEVYERHMADPQVGQLQRLHEITGEQLATYPTRTVGVLGVAGGNGLDLIAPASVDAVYGYDVNPVYLATCESRYGAVLGGRLHLVETRIDRSVTIEPVGLLIANLVIEYVGVEEFVAFVRANVHAIGTLSCVIQRNDNESFVSATDQSSSFRGLASVSSDVDSSTLTAALSAAGFPAVYGAEYPLPNGKALVRMDFQITAAIDPGPAHS